ncbi:MULTISPECIES: cyclic nucleotide-binding domain-containing protein [Shinella]|uniref:Cyclic nucleotide-binding protein n=2 Tax=Shinella TaxID=323620 RepID=A0A4V2RIR6_SHIGR|nr:MULTISPECIES: cyclic nucleotide-binding domain-containing protein [Shinella]ANH05896.1 protein kinase [Shinella sp. HZN7]MCJ8027936.1 cyclic nucleotide-binding domain-containing protein [Shinella yambaruensis]MCU7980006.1 cyclic nucleotide-binding domain-containing protein [Shinella yambaruensis]MCW5709970.1 cyclic nucleotide-binding domain-containing protein [Shinella sp.]TCN45300.1 cyclic nucleotide-binding protein [Shinella granuli]
MGLSDDIALLSRVPLFAGLADDKLRLMAFGAERRRLVEGQTLFREGTSADCGFVVAYGAFRLTSTLRDGTTRDEGTAGAGTLLSELAMISAVERKYTAVATEDSEVIRINRPLFRRMLEEYPDVAVLVDARIRENLSAMISQMRGLAGRFA